MSIYNSLVIPIERPNKAPTKTLTKEIYEELYLSAEAPNLTGFSCGNTRQHGCLTLDHTVRLHSCEKGNYCETVRNSSVVWIRPIVARLPDGQSMEELGVGGGGDDFQRDAELDYLQPAEIESLLEM